MQESVISLFNQAEKTEREEIEEKVNSDFENGLKKFEKQFIQDYVGYYNMLHMNYDPVIQIQIQEVPKIAVEVVVPKKVPEQEKYMVKCANWETVEHFHDMEFHSKEDFEKRHSPKFCKMCMDNFNRENNIKKCSECRQKFKVEKNQDYDYVLKCKKCQ
jgi:hypothetical protein